LHKFVILNQQDSGSLFASALHHSLRAPRCITANLKSKRNANGSELPIRAQLAD
jgi:hypothetical protein